MTPKSLALTLLVVIFVTGCTTVSPKIPNQHPPASINTLQLADISERGWWYARFRLHWPEGSEPAWYLDPLIANEVIAPALNRYANRIDLWRFHRRAGRDGASHQFSFIFYSTPASAKEIYNTLEINRHLQALVKAGKIENAAFDSLDKITKPAIEDTSDANWPVEIQKSWPYFIMGSSQMWLKLTQQLANQQQKNFADLETRYRHVHNQLLALWKHEGNHALLHHLNALYGYQPLIVVERKLLNF